VPKRAVLATPRGLFEVFNAVGDPSQFWPAFRRFAESSRTSRDPSHELAALAIGAHMRIAFAGLGDQGASDVLRSIGLTAVVTDSSARILAGPIGSRLVHSALSGLHSGVLVLGNEKDRTALSTAIASAAYSPGATTALRISSPETYLRCDGVGAQEVLVTIACTDIKHTRIGAGTMFRLSRREAALVDALCRGLTLREWALSQGVALSTAKTHLRSAFLKTRTRSQAELLRLMIHAT
jgi:DNA-binding CsgD family transcriptional regulator